MERHVLFSWILGQDELEKEMNILEHFGMGYTLVNIHYSIKKSGHIFIALLKFSPNIH